MSERQGKAVALINSDFCQRLLEKYEQNLTTISRQDLKVLIHESQEEMSMNSHLTMLFDFCIIASEADLHTARKVKQDLSQEFHLKGCLVEDVASAGKHTFDLYENMIERSTKILFLITNNFTSDGFCMRIQNGAVFKSVVEKAGNSREKCVPLILESGKNVKFPLALTGITGIKYNDTDVEMSPVLVNTFANVAMKREIMQRRYHQQYFKALLDSNIRKYFEEQNDDMKDLEFTPTLQIKAAPVAQDLVTQLQSLAASVKSKPSKCNNLPSSTAENSSNQQYQITSSENVQFGDNTVINVYLGGNKPVKQEDDEDHSSCNSSEEWD